MVLLIQLRAVVALVLGLSQSTISAGTSVGIDGTGHMGTVSDKARRRHVNAKDDNEEPKYVHREGMTRRERDRYAHEANNAGHDHEETSKMDEHGGGLDALKVKGETPGGYLEKELHHKETRKIQALDKLEAMTSARSFERKPPLGSVAVDCQWGEWTKDGGCPWTCGGRGHEGQCWERNKKQEAENGGAECEYEDKSLKKFDFDMKCEACGVAECPTPAHMRVEIQTTTAEGAKNGTPRMTDLFGLTLFCISHLFLSMA